MHRKYNYVYPGHPLVIAVYILEKYSSYQEASKPCIHKETGKPFGFPEVLGDNDIPGAGGPVYSALRILELSPDEAIKESDKVWQCECGGCYADRYDEGVREAKALEPLFRELREKWNKQSTSTQST